MKNLVKILLPIFSILALFSCTNEKSAEGEFSVDENIIKHERELRYSVIKKLPIAQNQDLKSARYFASSDEYILPATLNRDKEPKKIKIISPENLSEIEVLKIGSFELYYNNEEHKLPVYGLEEAKNKYLLIFFKDKTSGKETIPFGRYLKIEEDDEDEDEYIIDFNLAFNPISVYLNTSIQFRPPTESILPFAVKAGEMHP